MSWPLRPLLVFFSFPDILDVPEGQWCTKISTLSKNKYLRGFWTDFLKNGHSAPGAADSNPAELIIFCLTSNFYLWYFFGLLIYKNAKYLIWKIYFISVRNQILGDLLWLLVVISAGQSDPKTLHKMQIDPEWMSQAVFEAQ